MVPLLIIRNWHCSFNGSMCLVFFYQMNIEAGIDGNYNPCLSI